MTESKGIFMVSLNSKRLDDFIKNKQPLSFEGNIAILDVIVFDVFETLNGLFFNERNVQQQNKTMEDAILLVTEEIVNFDSSKRKLKRFTQLQKEIAPYLAVVYNEYHANPSFKRQCKSQIFHNLQPKLRGVGILSHKSELLELITPFLLAEIAFYLFVFDRKEYDVIYGLETEMLIVQDLKNNKYPSFSKFIQKKVRHCKIQEVECFN